MPQILSTELNLGGKGWKDRRQSNFLFSRLAYDGSDCILETPSLGYILYGDHLESGMLWELNVALKFARCVVGRSTFRSSEFILCRRWLRDSSRRCVMWLYGVLAGRSNVIVYVVWNRLMRDCLHSPGLSYWRDVAVGKSCSTIMYLLCNLCLSERPYILFKSDTSPPCGPLYPCRSDGNLSSLCWWMSTSKPLLPQHTHTLFCIKQCIQTQTWVCTNTVW